MSVPLYALDIDTYGTILHLHEIMVSQMSSKANHYIMRLQAKAISFETPWKDIFPRC